MTDSLDPDVYIFAGLVDDLMALRGQVDAQAGTIAALARIVHGQARTNAMLTELARTLLGRDSDA